MKRSTVIVLAAVVVLLGVLASVAWIDTTRPVLRETIVAAPTLGRELTILHASDLHTARFGTRQRDIDALLEGRTFDAAIITGDMLVHGGGDRSAIYEFIAVLKRHTNAIIFVSGNHDDPQLSTELEKRGVTVLGDGLVARIGDPQARATVISADRDGRITAPVAMSAPIVIVAMHQPPDASTLAEARRHTSGLQLFLAGHTHGGQIRIPLVGAVVAPYRWEFDFGETAGELFPELNGRPVQGAYRIGAQAVEISPGLGTTIVPIRLFDPAGLEIVRLVP
ncbi:MAG: metallophosphoesterase [Coriobacteriia bacterium]|nr:metallophosphoesterase [Coriobacteriia bacterium]